MHDYLTEILKHKHQEIENLKKSILNEPQSLLAKLYRGEAHSPSIKSLRTALASGNAVIAEIKRRSPSKNHLAEIGDPIVLAEKYISGGAKAISVLTDSFGFGGSLEDLKNINHHLNHTPCVVLRKDFILDPI